MFFHWDKTQAGLAWKPCCWAVASSCLSGQNGFQWLSQIHRNTRNPYSFFNIFTFIWSYFLWCHQRVERGRQCMGEVQLEKHLQVPIATFENLFHLKVDDYFILTTSNECLQSSFVTEGEAFLQRSTSASLSPCSGPGDRTRAWPPTLQPMSFHSVDLKLQGHIGRWLWKFL